MGLFGSSRKKPRDPFQAAVEQHQRRPPAARRAEMQSGSVRQRNAASIRRGAPNAYEHPYTQPGLGFYSGENLAAPRLRQQEPKRFMSVDESLADIPQPVFSDPLWRSLPYSSYPGYPGPCLGITDDHNLGSTPWLDVNPWSGSGLRDGPYAGPDEHFLYPNPYDIGDYLPSTTASPLSRSMAMHNHQSQPRNAPLGVSQSTAAPTFDQIRPFRTSPTINPYVAAALGRNVPMHRHPHWHAFPGRTMKTYTGMRPAMGRADTPLRPPGSYERLRPPHLQRGH